MGEKVDVALGMSPNHRAIHVTASRELPDTAQEHDVDWYGDLRRFFDRRSLFGDGEFSGVL